MRLCRTWEKTTIIYVIPCFCIAHIDPPWNATTIWVYGKEKNVLKNKEWLVKVPCALLLLSSDFSGLDLTVASHDSSTRVWNLVRTDINTELRDVRAGHAASSHHCVCWESADCEASGIVIVVPQECGALTNNAIPIALIEGGALPTCRLASHFDATRGESVFVVSAVQRDAVKPRTRTSVWLSGEYSGLSAGRALTKISAIVCALLCVRTA